MATSVFLADPMRRWRLLRGLALFASLDDQAIVALDAEMEWQELAAQQALFHVGDAASDMYVVASGRAPTAAVAAALASELGRQTGGQARLVRRATVEAQLGAGSTEKLPGSVTYQRVTSWLEALERDGQAVVLEADPDHTAWTRT